MDLQTQVANSQATKAFSSMKQKPFQAQDKPTATHQSALQALSNGENPPYSASLRIVDHEGSPAPYAAPQATRKPSCYCRNENGGYFTS